MGHRTAKASSMLSKMKYKGITSVGISNRATVKILYATIIPSLIYGMESFYLTKSQYEALDTFAADALKYKPTQEDSDKPLWNLFEKDMVPPSTLVKIAKLKLVHKIRNLPEEHLLSKLHSNKNTRIFKETKAIMKKWNSIEGLQEAIDKNKRSTMKLHLKELKGDIVDLSYMISIRESHMTELPLRLPRLTHEITKQLLHQRKKSLVLSSDKGPCLLCHNPMINGSHTHFYLECHNLARQLRENSIWNSTNTYDNELTEHLKGLPKPDLMMYLLGFEQFGNKEMNNVVLKTSYDFFTKFTHIL
jgi:hypothetical protein